MARGDLTYLEIKVDGKSLAHHFSGRLGNHPSHLSPLGWSSANDAYRAEIVGQLLGERSSELESGRCPVLVCEECGDIGCGAFAVRIVRDGELIRWTDWAYENGYEPPQELSWPTRPGDLVFDRMAYDAEIGKGL